MKDFDFVSKATIDRLPLYYRCLNSAQMDGQDIISSEELGQRIGITPEQIRKDLSSFGEFGKKGVGYYVNELRRNIGEILGLNLNWSVVIIGVGHLGWALTHYQNFAKMGFQIKGLFDIDSEKVGRKITGIEIKHLNCVQDFVKQQQIDIAVITVPADNAQQVVDQLVSSGIKGIWNFAPVRLVVPEHISLINEDLTVGLVSLSYYLTRRRK